MQLHFQQYRVIFKDMLLDTESTPLCLSSCESPSTDCAIHPCTRIPLTIGAHCRAPIMTADAIMNNNIMLTLTPTDM